MQDQMMMQFDREAHADALHLISAWKQKQALVEATQDVDYQPILAFGRIARFRSDALQFSNVNETDLEFLAAEIVNSKQVRLQTIDRVVTLTRVH